MILGGWIRNRNYAVFYTFWSIKHLCYFLYMYIDMGFLQVEPPNEDIQGNTNAFTIQMPSQLTDSTVFHCFAK